MQKKTYTAPEADIEMFDINSKVFTLDTSATGGLDDGDNVIDF